MRIFYIYNINEFFYDTYRKYPYKLYKMLEGIYYTNKYDLVMGSSLYEQVLSNFDKSFINDYILSKHKLDVYYYRKNNMHLLSGNLEYSKLMVNSYCLKLKTNVNFPKFLETINECWDNIFVCDFLNQDYFFLKNCVKSIVKE